MNTQATEKRNELVEELRVIQDEILESLRRAKNLIREGGYDGALQRAEAYWLAHARIAITNDHGYLGGSMCSMEDTITEIEESDSED